MRVETIFTSKFHPNGEHKIKPPLSKRVIQGHASKIGWPIKFIVINQNDILRIREHVMPSYDPDDERLVMFT